MKKGLPSGEKEQAEGKCGPKDGLGKSEGG